MRKFICSALSVVLAACCLTACSQPSETGQTPEGDSPSTVTDFVIGDVETHEPILPWQFEEGETAENPYYKRTIDENGTNVYAVLKASDNQVAYLPMSNTVVYMGAVGSECFFEQTTNTYKLDGEDQAVIQFQLYVADAVEEIAPEAPIVADDIGPEDTALEGEAIETGTANTQENGSAEP